MSNVLEARPAASGRSPPRARHHAGGSARGRDRRTAAVTVAHPAGRATRGRQEHVRLPPRPGRRVLQVLRPARTSRADAAERRAEVAAVGRSCARTLTPRARAEAAILDKVTSRRRRALAAWRRQSRPSTYLTKRQNCGCEMLGGSRERAAAPSWTRQRSSEPPVAFSFGAGGAAAALPVAALPATG